MIQQLKRFGIVWFKNKFKTLIETKRRVFRLWN